MNEKWKSILLMLNQSLYIQCHKAKAEKLTLTNLNLLTNYKRKDLIQPKLGNETLHPNCNSYNRINKC